MGRAPARDGASQGGVRGVPPCPVHGSWGNTSGNPRRAIVLNYFAHGTRAYMEGSLLKGVPAVRPGEVLGGQFHPVVFNTSRVNVSALPVASS